MILALFVALIVALFIGIPVGFAIGISSMIFLLISGFPPLVNNTSAYGRGG